MSESEPCKEEKDTLLPYDSVVLYCVPHCSSSVFFLTALQSAIIIIIIIIVIILAEPMACESSQVRDQTHATAVTMPDPVTC